MSFSVKRAVVTLFLFMPLTACGSEAEPDQEFLCIVGEPWREAAKDKCEVGQKIAFLPDQWGNKQLPVVFIANNCDMRYSVALTEAGAVCIYKPVEDDSISVDNARRLEEVK